MMPDNDNFEKWLEEGENIHWSGSPQPYGLFDEVHKTSTLVALCWAVVWGAILVGGYYALSVSRDLEIKTSVMVICAAVPLLIAWSPVGDKSNIKKLRYAVTDKKMIVISSEGGKECILPIMDLDAIRIEKAGDGTCHLRFGSSIFNVPARKLPSLAIRGEYEVSNNTRRYTGLVFYNVKTGDGETICDFLKPHASIEDRAR
jgi:hypothetical protein